MSCDPVALTELFFGELPADTAASIQRHAHACADCTRVLKELREDRERFSTPRSAPPAFDQLFFGIERRIAQAEAPPRRRPAIPKWLRSGAWLRAIPTLLPVTAGGLALVLAFLVTGAPSHRALRPGGLRQASTDLAVTRDTSDEITQAEAQLSACLISTSASSSQSAEACF